MVLHFSPGGAARPHGFPQRCVWVGFPHATRAFETRTQRLPLQPGQSMHGCKKEEAGI